MSIVFGYYSAPTSAAGQGKWNFFRGVGVCFGLPLPDFLAFLLPSFTSYIITFTAAISTVTRLSYTCTLTRLSYTLRCPPLVSYMNINYIVYNSCFAYIISKPYCTLYYK